MKKLIWIIDNPYGNKFTATKTTCGTVSDITRSQAKVMSAEEHGVWTSARAEVNLKSVKQEEKKPLGYSMPGVAKKEYSYSFWN